MFFSIFSKFLNLKKVPIFIINFFAGTRTLIDNLDNGVSATNITMKYNGFVNCFQSIMKHEGTSALYSVRVVAQKFDHYFFKPKFLGLKK
jgi:vancomycin permeability regulator SanA